MSLQEVNVTYDTLFDLTRREKTREELQALDATFIEDVVSYLKEKKAIIASSQQSDNVFAKDEEIKTKKELENIYHLIKDLYERRERKILLMALAASRTKGIIDTSTLLPHEQRLYDDLLRTLQHFNMHVLQSVLQGNTPALHEPKAEASEDTVKPSTTSAFMLVRMKTAVPEFAGPNLESYGPYVEHDLVRLPKELAKVLIARDRAEQVEP